MTAQLLAARLLGSRSARGALLDWGTLGPNGFEGRGYACPPH
jgi:hypothetical protein